MPKHAIQIVMAMNIRELMSKQLCSQRGFTLIETLVALAIFAIGVVACYIMQVHSIGTAGRANSISTSSTWATYAIEKLLSLAYDDPLLQNDAGNANGLIDIDDIGTGTPDGEQHIRADGTVGTTAGGGDLYSVFWNVVDDRPLTSVKQIRVIVVKNSGLNSGVLYFHDYYKTNENL